MSQILLAAYGTSDVISPDDLAGLILWLKADALGLSDNDPVASWTDSSGEGNNAVQASGSAQPLFKTNVLNSLPVIRFDGSDDSLAVPGLAYGVFTIFYVYIASVGGIVAEHSVNASANNGDYHYQPGFAHFACMGAGGFSAHNISAPSLATGTWRYISRTMDGTDAGHLEWVNGIASTRSDIIDSSNPGTGTATADYFIGGRAGASLFTTGDIAEIIVYDNVLSDANRQGIQNFLAAKYAL